jgi:Protein of unknown function (DUF3828)
MKRLSVLAVLLTLATAAHADPASPDSVVRAIYVADAPSIKGTGEGVMGDKAARAKFFTAGLLRMIVADENRSAKRNQPPNLDGDPFADAQEATVNDLKISVISVTGPKASVLADFDRGEGKREKVTYSMALERGAWRIDDIAYDLPGEPARTLRGELNEK